MSNPNYYTSAQHYEDDNGQMRNFTNIDYSPRTKVSSYVPTGEAASQHQRDRESLIERILSLPASLVPQIFTDFTIKGEGVNTIEWNTTMLTDAGLPFDKLRDIYTIVKNRLEINTRKY